MHLVFFMTRAVSLHVWEKQGLLEREIALYNCLRSHLTLTLVTGGGVEELKFQEKLSDIRILYNRWGLPTNAYSLLAPILHGPVLRTATIFKTNQLDGAWTALLAGLLYRKPVIVRAGYLWAENFAAQYDQQCKAKFIKRLQSLAFSQADSIILTTPAMKNYLIETDRIPADKIEVVPNYVDTTLFRPLPEIDKIKDRVSFVGRLIPVKNLETLIKSLETLPQTHLILIGQGEQQASLAALAQQINVNINFPGILPNHQLPVEINRSEIFVLLSHFEGHPKALIEAMACGAAVIGADVKGINNLIVHEKTGLLCPPTVDGARFALKRLLDDADLRTFLGQNARAFVEKEYSLDRIVQRELSIFESLHTNPSKTWGQPRSLKNLFRRRRMHQGNLLFKKPQEKQERGLLDIICFSSSDWYGKWGSRQQVMMRLAARGHRVLFIEQMAGLEHFWKYDDLRARRWRRWREGLREIKPNLWLLAPPPLWPGRYYFRPIAALNSFLVRGWLRSYLVRLGLKQPIIWLYQPEHTFLLGHFDEQLAVYHCIDEFTVGTHGRKRQSIETLEKDLLTQADIVFANSRLTYENKRVFNPNTYRLPSGVDVDHFAQATDPLGEIHPALVDLPHPVLAFVGNINEKIDIELLTTVANTRPDWSIVMIGQPHPNSVDLKPLQAMANVHWLGKQPFDRLPALLRGVDVCLLPYVQGEATLYRSPLKLYEYLATGKPIVSTPQPEVNEFCDLVKIASRDNFLSALIDALNNDTVELQRQRMQAACQHSWEARVQIICEVLQRALICQDIKDQKGTGVC